MVNTDLIGKSDPYAVIPYGNDKVKSKAVKNSQNPEWNVTAQIPVDEGTPDSFKIKVFDKDKFGKHKSLGSTEIDVANIVTEQTLQLACIPLDGVKYGQIQVSADYEPSDSYGENSRKTSGLGRNFGDGKRVNSPRSDDSSLRDEHGNIPSDSFDRGSKKNSGLGSDSNSPPGNLHLEIIEAKNLIKADMIGKSDPYAVVTYGDGKLKTKTRKNDQNPKWDFARLSASLRQHSERA